jgi:Holliday junction DNA helicase RuvA
LPEVGQPVILHVHTHVREDAISLFGFHTPEEREVFQLMISVSGIGPKLAVNVLSGIDARQLVRAVMEGDAKRLISIPGVGRKMAERMILELKEKVTKLEGAGEAIGIATAKTDLQIQEDAVSALINLGYRVPAAKDAIERVLTAEPDVSLDRLLKESLRVLAG